MIFLKFFFFLFPPFFFYLLFLPFIILFSSSSRHSVGGDEQESEKFFPAKKKNRMCKKWHAKEHSLSTAVSLTTMVNRNRHAPSCLPFLARLFSFLSQLIFLVKTKRDVVFEESMCFLLSPMTCREFG